MAMPSGNGVEKIQFNGGSGGIGGGGEIYQRQDERDALIYWLRCEFAAANAIIDALCYHLRLVNEPGEYDGVIGSIDQRRCNWSPVLYMQHYFPVAEVVYALQQVMWMKERRSFEEFIRSTLQTRDENSLGSTELERSKQVSDQCEDDKVADSTRKQDHKSVSLEDAVEPSQVDSSLNCSENSEGTMSKSSEAEAKAEARVVDVGLPSTSIEDHSNSAQNHNEKQIFTPIPKTFVGTETFEGKMVNVVEGLKLYEELFDATMVSKLVSLVNGLRAAGKRGQIQGPAYVVSKRPIRGHGREMIQLGTPISEVPPEDENADGTSKDWKIEPIPALMQDVIEQIVSMQIVTVKPDSCIIDFYKEGDYSQPHMWPVRFGRPVCVLFLTECDMTFGRIIGSDYPGDYRGSLKLSLEPGSLLAMQEKSTDVAKHAIPFIHKQRILVTFTKSQPKVSISTDGQRHVSPEPFTTSHWGSTPSRSPNHIHHHTGPKHYPAVPTIGVLLSPAPPIQSQILPPNGLQSLYVPTPVAPAMPFPAPVSIPPGSTGWPAAAPARQPPPRLLGPGTGVFLPPPSPGNSSSSQHSSATGTETNFPVEMPSLPEKGNKSRKSNHPTTRASPKVALGTEVPMQECNATAATTQEQQTNTDNEMTSKLAKAG